MTLTDEELDRDWKPNGRRPQSTIARSFSAELMDIFRIENSVADLDEQVDKRKQQVTSQTSELEALEARIREMEAILKSGGQPASAAESAKPPTSPHARPPISGVFADQPGRPLEHRQHQQQHQQQQHQQQQQQGDVAAQKYAGSRPGTARTSQQAVPGALPPTPVGSEDGDGERTAA